jgi:hypothetical protein
MYYDQKKWLRRITRWINLTALGRHALCLTRSIRVGLIAKVAPVTLQARPSGPSPPPVLAGYPRVIRTKNKNRKSETGQRQNEHLDLGLSALVMS